MAALTTARDDVQAASLRCRRVKRGVDSQLRVAIEMLPAVLVPWQCRTACLAPQLFCWFVEKHRAKRHNRDSLAVDTRAGVLKERGHILHHTARLEVRLDLRLRLSTRSLNE